MPPGLWFAGGVVKFPFKFTSSVMRAKFHQQDGQLYICDLSEWQSNAGKITGFDRVRYTGKQDYSVRGMKVVKNGVASLNPQTSLYEQKVLVTNSTPYNFTALRIYVPNLTNTVRLQNAAGTNSLGVPYVEFSTALPAGEARTFTLEYFSQRLRPFPSPAVILELQEQGSGFTPVGQYLAIDRVVVPRSGRVYVEFTTRTNTVYWIQYTDSLGLPWKTSSAQVRGTGYKIHWLDEGPPKTDSAPTNGRLYRIVVPQ